MADGAQRDGGATGFICPRCGGALWNADGDAGDGLRFECRIGDSFSAAEMWIEHCAARNTALKHAHRALLENAALARKLAEWTRARGNDAAADRLEAEAADEGRLGELVARMLEGLPLPDEPAVGDLEAG